MDITNAYGWYVQYMLTKLVFPSIGLAHKVQNFLGRQKEISVL